MYGQLYGGGGEDELGPGIFTHGEGLVKGPGEGLKVGGVGRGRCCLDSDGERDGPRKFTDTEKPCGRRQLDSRRTRAAMSGKVAAIAVASV